MGNGPFFHSVFKGITSKLLRQKVPLSPKPLTQMSTPSTPSRKVKSVSLLVKYSVIDPNEYGVKDKFTVEDFIAWGKRAVFHVINFYGGIHPTFEYDEALKLYRVSYTQNPKYVYENASAMIADPDNNGNFPIIKGESCGCNCMSKSAYRGCKCKCHDEDYEDTQRCYLVSGKLKKITLTYHDE